MAIRAVVLDIGGVLEVVDDDVFPAPAERRLGLAPGSIAGGLAGLPGDAVVGEVTEHQVRAEWQRAFGLDDRQVAALLDDFWRWYVGTLDRELFDWFAGQRPARLTAILSNSGPGARERERFHGFEDVTDDIVYSHEVGLAKPDPAAYKLVTRRLGVEAAEVLFLDDVEANVVAARALGWHAVLHLDTAASIAEMERVIEAVADA
ncbi:HAD-IA family hydrolase [Nocardioides cavernae]|uniref:HAD-IA family hydrolase n=1 Tax=Nocardioides cavernae TaxID=1921566 RepID=A0ABR8NGB5_9ACTN|nr:HAD-IA family hydrolase [Nocardioides cavernae]MBD3927152.1 HAD-IA family hydrolase [Nocardioides cavernae]MBM7512872.1 putative hydrolase of the HAD superfamily [Nocardioides cavernae]